VAHRIPTFTQAELVALSAEWIPPKVRPDLEDVPKRRNAQDEHHIQTAFVKWLDVACVQRPELALGYAIPNVRKSMLDAVLRYREGARSGPADWCLPLPHGRLNGLYLEFKRPKGTTAATQRHWLLAVTFCHFLVSQPESVEAAIDTVMAYMAKEPGYDVAQVRYDCEQLLAARAEQRAKRQRTNARRRAR